jgi:energy-coupling factor transporter ATP-binding protein EcfA2
MSLLKTLGISPKLFDKIRPNEFCIEGGMVVYLTGPKGAGKSTLLAHLAGQIMLPPLAREKVLMARTEAEFLQKYRGFTASVPKNIKHTVYSDVTIRTCKDSGYLPRVTHDLYVERMTLPTEDNNAQFFPRGATLIIDELMEKFDGRDFNTKDRKMTPEDRKFLQTLRHRGLSIITGCLIASGTDTRFRKMSQNVFLIVDKEDVFSGGTFVGTLWRCLEFASDTLCDKFLQKQDGISVTPRLFFHKGNIYSCTDSYAENESFIVGMEKSEFGFKEGK